MGINSHAKPIITHGPKWFDMNVAAKRDEQYLTEKRKCLYHPAMKCPTPDKPCILAEACKTKK